MMEIQKSKVNLEHHSIILITSDIESIYASLREKGVTVGELMRMPYGIIFNFIDNEGNNYLIRED